MNQIGSQQQINYGIVPETVELHADGIATREAILVAGLADCTWPSHDERLVRLISEVMVKHIGDFAIAARRSLEISDQRNIAVYDISRRLGIRVNIRTYGGDLWNAVNCIIHARKIVVMTWEMGAKLFPKVSDRRISHLNVHSDQGSEVYLCPFGLAHAYLGRNGHLRQEILEGAR